MTSPIWSPRFTLTPAIARGLMQIEAARAIVDRTLLSPSAKVALRARARMRSSHFSIFIEGNRLTLEEAKAVIGDEKTEIEGRERDISRFAITGMLSSAWRSGPGRKSPSPRS